MTKRNKIKSFSLNKTNQDHVSSRQ